MTAFLISLAVLVGGYFLYGLLAEKVFGTDPARTMPAYSKTDGVDFMPMPTWKVFLIQFLNIAGLGPIFGRGGVRRQGLPGAAVRHGEAAGVLPRAL